MDFQINLIYQELWSFLQMLREMLWG